MKILSRILFIAAFTFAFSSCLDDAPVSVSDRDASDVLRYSSSALVEVNGTAGTQKLYAGQDTHVGYGIATKKWTVS